MVDSHKSTGDGPVRSPVCNPSKKTKNTKQTTKTNKQTQQTKQATKFWLKSASIYIYKLFIYVQ